MHEVNIIKPIYWGGREDTGRQLLFEMNGETFVMSQTLLDRGVNHYNEWETMVFSADERGRVQNWSERWCHREAEQSPLEDLIEKIAEEGLYEYSPDQVD